SPKERGHLVLQIGTSDPQRAVQVAQMVERDVDGIDVNMGCPKAFSLKGGMGAALLSHPDKIQAILTALVASVSIPVTCKIRIKDTVEKTMEIVKVIESTGVRAFAVHGRTKDERPNHAVHTDAIQAIVKQAAIPVIANGGSSNNRNSSDNTYDGIKAFWKETGAASVMVARAAEWNPSVFRPEGKAPVMEVVHKYLDYAIHYDYTFVIVKYTVQQILGSEQDSEMGKRFLHSATMRDLCAVFGREKELVERQDWIRQKSNDLDITSTTFRFCRDAKILPKKRKLSEPEIHEYRAKFQSLDNQEKRECSKSDTNQVDTEETDEVTSMFCPFVRNHYRDTGDIPKCLLLTWTLENALEKPQYVTERTDKTFRSVVRVNGRLFESESWEKNKKYAEQASAIVALHCLGIRSVNPEHLKNPNKS
ncbi:hypothetical protein TCAL_13181, partial [Tigriopus californicus]